METALTPEPELEAYIHFETSEFGLATFLYSLGAIPIHIDKSKPNQVLFHFELTDKQRDAVINWSSAYNSIKRLAFD